LVIFAGCFDVVVIDVGSVAYRRYLARTSLCLSIRLKWSPVGIIALADVQLAQKAITDKLTRALVFLGGVVWMLYTALWFFPVLMLAAGIAMMIWDFRWLHRILKLFWRRCLASMQENGEGSVTGRDSQKVL
jgi:chromate transport protein ChrA